MADRDSTLEPVTAPEPETLPSEHDRSRASLLGKLLAPLVLLGGIVLKFGAFTLKFFGIFLAVGGYTLIWGWRFAVGVVLLILATSSATTSRRGGPASTRSSPSSCRSSAPTSRSATCASIRG